MRSSSVGPSTSSITSARFFDSVNLRDVGMVQRRQHLGLALEARHALAVVRERLGQNLDRHVAFQLGIVGAVHLAHAAGADGREDLVGAQFVTQGELHTGIQFSLPNQNSRLSLVNAKRKLGGQDSPAEFNFPFDEVPSTGGGILPSSRATYSRRLVSANPTFQQLGIRKPSLTR